MISDDLDTSGMMKCYNEVNQELTRVSPISSVTCTNLAVSDTLSILAKSHQTSHDRVLLRFSGIINYISCLHMSRAKPSLMPNQSLP
jgi:hypothetical protein